MEKAETYFLVEPIIRNPDIYIFDEATSNIDVESEEKIWESIEKISKDKTVIIISHRLLNVKNADTIYMLENGVIAESGNHNELMLKGGVYKNLVDHQNDLENIYSELESKNLEKTSDEIEVI